MSAVSEIMSPKNVITADIGNSTPSALEISKLMVKHKVGSVVLVDSKLRPRGIITERDILKRVSAANKTADKVPARAIMSSPVITVKAYDSIETAASIMAKNKIKRIAVVEQDGILVGMLSVSDITAKLARILIDEYYRHSKLKAAIELVNG